MTSVVDGDTLVVATAGGSVRVRLEGIDAPALRQRFGKSARLSLAQICSGKQARVVERAKEDRGVRLASVTCAGVNASVEQVRRGMAWVSSGYMPLGPPLYEFEANARFSKAGLWRDPSPIPPWKWNENER